MQCVQCNFSNLNTLGTKEKVQFREVSGFERFYMCSKYGEQDKYVKVVRHVGCILLQL